MTTLRSTAPHFIRCIIPNETKSPGKREMTFIRLGSSGVAWRISAKSFLFYFAITRKTKWRRILHNSRCISSPFHPFVFFLLCTTTTVTTTFTVCWNVRKKLTPVYFFVVFFQVLSILTWLCTSWHVTVYLKVSVFVVKDSPTVWSTLTSSIGKILLDMHPPTLGRFTLNIFDLRFYYVVIRCYYH